MTADFGDAVGWTQRVINLHDKAHSLTQVWIVWGQLLASSSLCVMAFACLLHRSEAPHDLSGSRTRCFLGTYGGGLGTRLKVRLRRDNSF